MRHAGSSCIKSCQDGLTRSWFSSPSSSNSDALSKPTLATTRFAITMNGQMDNLRQEVLCHRQRSWQEDYTPQSPKDKLLSHIRQCWAEFCDDSSISTPATGFKNYLQHEPQFLEYLKRRDSCDDTSLDCYRRFFRYLAERIWVVYRMRSWHRHLGNFWTSYRRSMRQLEGRWDGGYGSILLDNWVDTGIVEQSQKIQDADLWPFPASIAWCSVSK